MRALVAACVLAACGTDAKTIDLAVPGTQVLVTEKVNGGAWKKLSGQFDGDANATTYSIEIGDEYELAVVCIRSGPRDAGQFVAAEVFGTSDDPEITLGSWELPNCLLSASGGLDPTGPRIKISGTFDEDMDLSVGRMAPAHVTGGHLFAFTIDPGRHDVIAYSNTKLVIQRNLQIEADTVLAPIHVGNEGTAVLSAAVTMTGDANEGAPTISDEVETANGTIFFWSNEDPTGALFIPPELLVPGDQQHFTVGFYTTTTGRVIDVESPERLGDAKLLAKISSATQHDDRTGMTWTPISEFYTTATVGTLQPTSNESEQRVTASRLWLERHGTSELDFDLAVDDYDPSWTVALPAYVTLANWSPGLVAYSRAYPAEAM